jgi:hypothetical protein
MPTDRETETTLFAGELLLTLASEGRLVLDSAEADRVIANLERSLAAVTTRLQASREWDELPHPRVESLRGKGAEDLLDGVFVRQVAPGLLEKAQTELPKYIEALRMARRTV